MRDERVMLLWMSPSRRVVAAALFVICIACGGEPDESASGGVAASATGGVDRDISSTEMAPARASDEASRGVGTSELPSPPDIDALRERWGDWLTVEGVRPEPGRSAVSRIEATLRRVGRFSIGLQIGWPRTVPETHTLRVRARGARRQVRANLETVEVCVGDRIQLLVPHQSPAPVWDDGLVVLGPTDEELTLRPIATSDLPASLAALSPHLGSPRTESRPEQALLVFWLRAQQEGGVAIELPLMASAGRVEIVPAARSLTHALDFTSTPGQPRVVSERVRVGDDVEVRYLRP